MARSLAASLFLTWSLWIAPSAAPGVTLQQLSSNELIDQSTAIVRCRVVASFAETIGPEIYTHYRLQISDIWKGANSSLNDVVFPGGSVGRLQQTVPGVPRLQQGQEYVLYLWTSPSSGLTFVTGFQQGIFHVSRAADGTVTVQRDGVSEMMLDSTGRPVKDSAASLRLRDLSARVMQRVNGATR